ncbi:hypothetical protein NEDG_02115 [Nematocida displodere]|uniref:Uncharacterized protein n=1 Tax=Nematocida displodere TaxID=1805483 RepID=A0A177EKG6_9MICR|nr:hypothetical protein NEDG_02115 [Nematocida displodere]
METKPVFYFRNIYKRIRIPHVLLFLALLSYIAHSTEEIVQSSSPEHIVSPYTKQTIRFFSRSYFENHHSTLEIVKTHEETHILKKQRNSVVVSLQKHNLHSVPEKLVQGIEFSTLKITSAGPIFPIRVDSAVLNKILCALGSIVADSLELYGLDVNAMNTSPSSIQRVAWALVRHKKHKTVPAPPTCILNIKQLLVTSVSSPTIKWFLAYSDMSQCRISLVISGGQELDSLEFLDDFKAAAIVELEILDILRLDSLDCKLLRDGPMPDVLTLGARTPISRTMSRQIHPNTNPNTGRFCLYPHSYGKC